MGDPGTFLEETGRNPPGVDELPIEASGSAYRLDGAFIGGAPFFVDDTALLGGAISAANGSFEATAGVLGTSSLLGLGVMIGGGANGFATSAGSSPGKIHRLSLSS